MMTLNDLYDEAESLGVEVDDVPMRTVRSVSFPEGWIALDTSRMTRRQEKAALAHELAHIETGAFYHADSPFSIREKEEWHARKHAIQKLIPYSDLLAAFRSGLRETWELADYFDLPGSFVAEAVTYYAG